MQFIPTRSFTPKADEIIHIEDLRATCLIKLPIKSRTLLNHPLQQNLDEMISKFKDLEDDRALVLVCALAVENKLDELLENWIPNYKKLSKDKNKELTFSFKIDLAKSLNLIPNKILNAIDPIRKIRNEFAHNLEIVSLKKLQKEKPGLFEQLNTKLKSFIIWNKTDIRETFKELTSLTVLALEIYNPLIKEVNNYIRRINLKEIFPQESLEK